MPRSDKETDSNVISFPLRPDTSQPARTPGPASTTPRPTLGQKSWLARGLGQPGGKLPLFDEEGQHYPVRTVRSCIDRGWAEPWFNNPLKPGWLVCKLTEKGRSIAAKHNRAGGKRTLGRKAGKSPGSQRRP